MWQAVTSVAALLTAVGGVVFAALAWSRGARSEDARRRADAAGVGLDYLREALAAQQETLVRQEGEIGALRGQLRECRDERHAMADQITELQRRMA